MRGRTTLSFQLTNSGKTIQVDCADEGLRTLIGTLRKLQQTLTEGRADHVHLWAGQALSESNPWGDRDVIQEVIITSG